jgi:hypothetical protein
MNREILKTLAKTKSTSSFLAGKLSFKFKGDGCMDK